MKVAVYPGTFDPITLGHLDIIRRGAHLVDKLVIGVTTNPSKEPMFSVEERLAMVRREVAGHPRQHRGGRVRFAADGLRRGQGATAILRGLRAVADFEYEFQMAGMNQQLNDDIETVFLMADVSLQPIASKLVKEIAPLRRRDRQVRHAGRRGGRAPASERRFTLRSARAAAQTAQSLGEGYVQQSHCSRCRCWRSR